MKFLKDYFVNKLSKEELLSLLIAKSFYGEDGDHLMEDGRTVFSRASRDPELKKWIEARKANLLKYATVDGMVPRIKSIIGEYEMLLGFMGASVKIPQSGIPDTNPDLSTVESITTAWKSREKKV